MQKTMSRMIRMTVWGVMLLFIVPWGCKKSVETQNPDRYVLTVSMGTGVSGSPAAGNTTHGAGSLVNYDYATEQGYKDLEVILDDQAVAESGVITMDRNHTLQASATKIAYMQGDWLIDISWTAGDCNVEDVSDFPCTGTQDGGNFTLTLEDIPVGEATMDLVLSGPIDEAGNFSLSGSQSVTTSGMTYVFEFSGSGKMDGENYFESAVDLAITLKEMSQTCNHHGTLIGTRIQ